MNDSLTIRQSNELTWSYFLEMMMFLKTVKRDDLPDEVIRGWFKVFKDRGWDKPTFDKSYQKVMTNKTFGAVKIDEFLNQEDEQTYSASEVSKIVERQINNMIRQGEKLLQDREIKSLVEYCGLDNNYMKIAVAHRLRIQKESDKYELYEKIIDEAVEYVKTKTADNGGREK